MRRTLPWLLLLALALTGCPKPPPPPQVAVSGPPPSAPAAPTAPPPRRTHFKLSPDLTQAKPFRSAGAAHEVSAKLIRLEVVDDASELDDEGLHPKTLAGMKSAGGSFLICVIEVKVDGKPLSDPSVKGTFRSLGLEFSYGGQVYTSVRGYVGPAPGHPDAQLHLSALEPVRGDGTWRLTQSLYLEDQTKVELEFSGEVALPEAG